LIVTLGALDLSIRRLISADRSLQPDGGQEAFWMALANGYPAVVVQQLLERADVDPNCRDGQGQAPLSWSGYRGYEWLARLLLGKGADVNQQDERGGRVALHWAASAM
jgi:ankyrin repeat protein